MNIPTQYFRNPAAEITYWPVGCSRTDWRSMARQVSGTLEYAFFSDAPAATAWLLS